MLTPHVTITLFHNGQPKGDIVKEWSEVGLNTNSRPHQTLLSKVMPQNGFRAYMEDDIIPVRQWKLEDYAGEPAMLAEPPSYRWWGMTVYNNGPWKSLNKIDSKQFKPILQQYIRKTGCPDWMPDELCEPALRGNAKIVGDHFLHIDKLSKWSRPNQEKEDLVAAVVSWASRQKPISSPVSKEQIKLAHYMWGFNFGRPGSHLKILLSKFGIKATANCSCNQKAMYMDAKGPDWCEKNIDLIVKWLEQEARKRRLPFLKSVGKILVKKAISNARKQNNSYYK